MRPTDAIVPPKPRTEEVRVMRRPKTRRALQVCVAAAASALVATPPVSPLNSHALIIVLVGVAFVSGVSGLVLRFVEQPREIVLRKVHDGREPSQLIH